MPPELIDRAVEHIADGHAVNWDLLDSQAHDEDERKQLKWLRVLEEIANLHRSTLDPLDSVGEAAPRDAAPHEDGRREHDAAGTAALAHARGSHPGSHPDRDPGGDLDPDPGGDQGGDAGGDAAGASTQTWGRYHLLDKVGEGSFGSVYRAWDPQLEREIAIKILHRHLTDERLRGRLLREGRALARIRQSHVVSVFGVESHEDRIGLCMEFVEGQTLEDVLHLQGTLSARETVLVGEDVCRALAAVHNAGFVHRDVKARNVMREQAGRIVLMDFGTGREARALEEARRPDVVGTPLYMAPEVLAGEIATTRSDVYSVGVLLYHLVTSAYPIEAHSIDDLRAAHHERRRTYLTERRPDLPTAFVRVIERALATDPEERQANAGALLAELAAVPGGQPETTPGVSRSLVGVALVGSLATWLPIGLGAISTVTYNAMLGRGDFATETLWDWWVWGIRSSIGQIWVLVWLLVGAGILLVGRRLVRWSAAGARLDARASRALGAAARRLSLDRAPVLASWLLVASSLACAATWWHYWPLIGAFGRPVWSQSLDTLALLSPALKEHHLWYRLALTLLVVPTLWAWYGVLGAAARQRRPVHPGVLAGAAAIVGLALVSLHMPYRLMLQNKVEAATSQGVACYVIGERGPSLLLFCPDQSPANRVVRRNADAVQRLGRRESMFTPLSKYAQTDAPRTGTE